MAILAKHFIFPIPISTDFFSPTTVLKSRHMQYFPLWNLHIDDIDAPLKAFHRLALFVQNTFRKPFQHIFGETKVFHYWGLNIREKPDNDPY